MDRAPPPGMPDRVGLSGHYQAITDSFRLIENSPAFTDPDISTKLRKLDEFTNTMNSFKDDMTQSLRQAIKDEMKSVKEDLESTKKDLKEDIKSVKEDLESTKKDLKEDIKSVKEDLKSVKEDLKSVKEDLKSVKEDLESTKKDLKEDIKSVKEDIKSVKEDIKSVKEDIKSVKEDLKSVKENLESVKENLESAKDDLITEIKTVEKSLRINIATRNTNAIACARNQWGDKIVPLRSVLSGAAIERFPTTRNGLESLPKTTAVKILKELDDLLIYDSDSKDVSQVRERLAMLVGITRGPFVANENVPVEI